jgi:hypothetical protein
LWIGRVIFGVLLVAAVIYTGQMTFVALSYHREIAATQLADAGALADLYVWAEVILRLFVHTFFIMTGMFVFSQRSHDLYSLLFAIWAVTVGTGGFGFYFAVPDMTGFLAEHGLLWGYYLLSPLGWASLQVLWILFPDGRFVPRWTRYFSIFALLLVVAWALPSDAPLYPFNWSPWLLFPIHAVLIFTLIGAQVYRYRRVSTPAQRQQTKWVVVSAFPAAVLYGSVFALPAFFPEIFFLGSAAYHTAFLIGQTSFIFFVVGLLVSILRYRLWDIDLVINRALVYGAAVLVAVLIGIMLVFGLQLVTDQMQPTLVMLLAAAVSILLFMPLRNTAQHLIDRYIYRFRFDLLQVERAQKLPAIKHPGALSGRKLGAYEVLDLLGRGGMGEVYRAVGNGETVAIKTMLTETTANEEVLQRFQREAQAGMNVNHPNIARVRCIDSQNGLLYMVMDYLQGHDLSVLLRQQGKLSSQKVIEIVTKLAEPLDAAHAEGLVHRDIKPSNIMLIPKDDNSADRVVLMDFGVTKVKGAKSLTNTGAIGTIDYMAPEQIMNAREVDHRADIYSTGIMMYQMLIGDTPFSGSVGQVLFAHIQQPAPDPRDADGSIPRPLAKAILKALAKDPDQRFQSVRELSEALQGIDTAQEEPPTLTPLPRDLDMSLDGLLTTRAINLS